MFFGCFWAYIGQPHSHIFSFASYLVHTFKEHKEPSANISSLTLTIFFSLLSGSTNRYPRRLGRNCRKGFLPLSTVHKRRCFLSRRMSRTHIKMHKVCIYKTYGLTGFVKSTQIWPEISNLAHRIQHSIIAKLCNQVPFLSLSRWGLFNDYVDKMW